MGLWNTDFNWLEVIACVVIGQIFLTIWFFAIFGEPWARAYGAADKAQHTKEIPGYTYAIGLICMILLVIGLASLQSALGVTTLGQGLALGLFVAIHFAIATAVPGYAFLKRWSACVLAVGSQTVLILLLSVILALWS